jgi:hypothetical protein
MKVLPRARYVHQHSLDTVRSALYIRSLQSDTQWRRRRDVMLRKSLRQMGMRLYRDMLAIVTSIE